MSDFDGFDALLVIVGVIITASSPTLLVALPLALCGWGLHALRRSRKVATWADSQTKNRPKINTVMPYLITGPKGEQQQEIVLTPQKQINKRNEIPWSERITHKQEAASLATTSNKLAAINKTAVEKVSTADNMNYVLSVMPKSINYNHPKLTDPPTPMSVLIGYDPLGKRWVWADFGLHGDTIHAFIAGQTRAGKDSEIRFWFTQLTSNNDPEDIQFVVIDAKGEWITPALKDSRHMAVPPVGGFKLKIERGNTGKRQLRDLANEDIEDALIDTIELLQARADLFQSVGATNLQAYERKTGKRMPILFVIVTDVGTNLSGILEELVRFLVLKGGSLGVRAIISMQTASGEDTSWRGQMGLAMSGYQGQASADAPNLGIPVRAMKYRPSELPSVDDPVNRGLFVVRKGIEQYVVRSAYLPDNIFESYCEDILPRKSVKTNNELLSSLLVVENQPQQQMVIAHTVMPKQVLTVEQARIVAQAAAANVSVSKILTDYLKFTNSQRYAEAKPHVQIIWNAVQRKKGAHV